MNHSLYLHIPFCIHRCAYCDFNTYAGKVGAIPAYIEALCSEIRGVGESAGEKLHAHTIFFGGGTPSLLSTQQFEDILQTLRVQFNLLELPEITLEANPGTVPEEYLTSLRGLGFNRLSLGVQSADDEELRLLGRIHDFKDVQTAVDGARRAGFDNLNLDLIFGLPGQSIVKWQSTIGQILEFQPEHLSLYALTVEPGTPFGRRVEHGLMPAPDPDVAAGMYEWADDVLAAEGYEHYEISNWAKPGCQCRHNLQYWRNLSYLGFGAGAHGFAGGVRYDHVLRINTFIKRMACRGTATAFPLSPATASHQHITPRVEMQETMLTGLRLTQEGVSAEAFRQRFGCELTDIFSSEIDELVRLGLLEWSHRNQAILVSMEDLSLRLTKRGRLLGNQVFIRFVG